MGLGLFFTDDSSFYVAESNEGYPFGLNANVPVRLSLQGGFIHVEEQDVFSAKEMARQKIESKLQEYEQKEENPDSFVAFGIRESKQELEEKLQQCILGKGQIPISSVHAIVHEYNEEKEIRRVTRKGAVVAGALSGALVGPFSAIFGTALGSLLKKDVEDEACKHALLIQFSLPNDDKVYCLNLSYKLDLSEKISLSKLSSYRSVVESIAKLLYVWDDYMAQNQEHQTLSSSEVAE